MDNPKLRGTYFTRVLAFLRRSGFEQWLRKMFLEEAKTLFFYDAHKIIEKIIDELCNNNDEVIVVTFDARTGEFVVFSEELVYDDYDDEMPDDEFYIPADEIRQ